MRKSQMIINMNEHYFIDDESQEVIILCIETGDGYNV